MPRKAQNTDLLPGGGVERESRAYLRLIPLLGKHVNNP